MITNFNELYQYGVLGMKWGVRHDKERAYARAKKKAGKIDKKIKAKQASVNKSYARAEKKLYGIFHNEKKAQKIFKDATEIQREVTRLERKGAKWIDAMKEIFSNAGYEIEPEVLKLGESYLQSVSNSSKSLYSAVLFSDLSKK